MQIVTVDFESYYSVTHSLTKMPPIEYVMHPDTEIMCVAIKINNNPTQVYVGDEIKPALDAIDWSDSFVLGHNMSEFDSLILSYRFGINPKQWGCTMAMARPFFSKTCGLKLDNLCEHFGIAGKDNEALSNVKGKHLCDLTEEELARYKVYNIGDVDKCYEIFTKLKPFFSKREFFIMDATIRMVTEPAFELDRDMLKTELDAERERKRMVLLDIATLIGAYKPGMDDDAAAEAARKTLASAAKFSELLKALNVPVPMKFSPSNEAKMIPALAKTDDEFIALQEHEDPLVAQAAQARLGVKSTLLETRISRFLANTVHGKLPILLSYCGADTTGRWSGSGKLNQQNLPRIPRHKDGSIIEKPTNVLRLCLRAPKGYKVVVADLSGIELRVNHFLWQVPTSMQMFKADPEKADLYKDFAATLYSVPREEVNKEQRQIGKVAHLGLGFGAGAATFQIVAKLQGGVDLSEDEAKQIVWLWRTTYSEITAGWKTCHAALPAIYEGTEQALDPWGLCHTIPGGIKTPQGQILYPSLRADTNEANGRTEWLYGIGRHKARIYAGKIDENIVQHLAREIIVDNALEVYRETGFRPKHTVHDELIYVVPEKEAQPLLDTLQSHMRTPPKWWPELVTWSEGDIADTYGDAK